MAQIVTAQFVGQTSCGFVSKKYYEIEISAGRSGCLCVRDVQGQGFTFDNGTEFAAAEELERSCVNKHLPRTKVYFCHPYSSWERGTNENTNGMIRRRFPKGTNFAAVTNAQITQAENWINNYPRKILGYKSSEIVFRECLRELGIAA